MFWNNWPPWLRGGILLTGIINIIALISSLIQEFFFGEQILFETITNTLISIPGNVLFSILPLGIFRTFEDPFFYLTEITFYFLFGAALVYLATNDIRWKSKSN